MLNLILNTRAKQLKKNQKGFTLVELIVVVAILGILAAIGIARFGGMTDKARLNSDFATAATIASAGQAWIADQDSAAKASTVSMANLQTASVTGGTTYLEGKVGDYKSQTTGKVFEIAYTTADSKLIVKDTAGTVFYPKSEYKPPSVTP